MPSLETSARYQKAVLWEYQGGTDIYGNPVLTEPEEITVRWQNKVTEMKDGLGNLVAVDAQVVVDRDVAIDSQMWEGELEDWLGSGSVGADDQVMTVKVFHKTPDLKGRNIRRVVGLVKSKDTPGEVS